MLFEIVLYSFFILGQWLTHINTFFSFTICVETKILLITKCNISSWHDLSSSCLTFTRLLTSPHLGVFIALGLSGVIPAMHYVITEGFYQAVNYAALGWLVLMAILYIVGAIIYAVRIPERIWPGKFDIWVRRCCFLFICWTHSV